MGTGFGTPATPGGGFGAPATPGGGFGTPTSGAGGFGMLLQLEDQLQSLKFSVHIIA